MQTEKTGLKVKHIHIVLQKMTSLAYSDVFCSSVQFKLLLLLRGSSDLKLRRE